MKNQADIIVVGSGPAGLLAAISASRQGARVIVLEKMDRPALKLGITGKGRCNVTNAAPMREFLGHTAPDQRYLKHAFSEFFSNDIIRLLEENGVPTIIERGERVFPESEQARDVVKALLKATKASGAEIITVSSVQQLLSDENNTLTGVKLRDGSQYNAKAIIVATGGLSYPATGSSGDGYKLAQQFGHSIIQPIPALVAFETAGEMAQQLQGLALKNVKASIYLDGKKAGDDFGEMLFTHFGVSGPIILTLNRRFGRAIANGSKAFISIDLKPALDDAMLDKRLIRELDTHGKMYLKSILKELLPSAMIPVCISANELPPDIPGNQVGSDKRKKIRVWIKDLRLDITGTRDFNEAIITSGGINLKEVDAKTMKSKLVPNLFFAGEILDLEADTGGYNLQIAYSTGWLAGLSAALLIK
ncbi:MAG: NAD(P)/FAD-dependent oxidoreductase [Bacteroidales bacterium]|nr:NAD(P)/FAD-dependent oxidoreductase [Bacteroidales bacterium]